MSVAVTLSPKSVTRLGHAVSFDVKGAPKDAKIRLLAFEPAPIEAEGRRLIYAAEGASLDHQFILGREAPLVYDGHGRPFPTSAWERRGEPAMCVAEVWIDSYPEADVLATLEFEADGGSPFTGRAVPRTSIESALRNAAVAGPDGKPLPEETLLAIAEVMHELQTAPPATGVA